MSPIVRETLIKYCDEVTNATVDKGTGLLSTLTKGMGTHLRLNDLLISAIN